MNIQQPESTELKAVMSSLVL